MFNIRAHNESGRVMRRTWFVTGGPQPELLSFWSVEALPDAVVNRNQPVTDPHDTERIACCA